MFPHVDFAIFPLKNPALVSVPLAFVLGYVATVLTPQDQADEARYAEMEVRALTGAGAERSSAQPAVPQPVPQARPALEPTAIDHPELVAVPAPRNAHRRPVLIATGVLAGVIILAVSISVNRVLASAPAEAAKPVTPQQAADIGPEVAIPALGPTIQVGKTPGFVAVSPNGRQAYIANRNAQIVTVVDTAVNQVTATIPITAGPPQFLAFAPDGRTLYVTIYNDTRTIHVVDVLDTATNTVVGTIPQQARPYLPAVTRDGKRLFIPNHDIGSVSVVSTDTNTVIAQVPVAPNPHSVAFSRDSSRAYTANHESNVVSVVDTTTLEVLATIPVGKSPHSIAVHPNLPLVAIVNYDASSVSMIDSITNRVLTTIPVGKNPQDIAWAPDGRFAYVVNEGSNTVSVIDVRSNRVTATIPTGIQPTSIAVLPNGRQAYVSNVSAGTLTILELTGRQPSARWLGLAAMNYPVPACSVADLPAGAVLLDVREDDEWAAGHAPDAVHVPMGQVVARLDEIAAALPDRPVRVVCRSGGRSARVTAYLKQAGWDVVNVDGGMRAWAAAGRPMVTDSNAAPRVL
jgi:YVTN family beta-propeller protein